MWTFGTITPEEKKEIDVGSLESWKDVPVPKSGRDAWRREIYDMHKAVTELGLWDKVRDEKPPEGEGYMWWKCEWLDRIYAHPRVTAHGFSGAVQAQYMHNITYIADNGWDAWVAAVGGQK